MNEKCYTTETVKERVEAFRLPELGKIAARTFSECETLDELLYVCATILESMKTEYEFNDYRIVDRSHD